jgi:hypothetical protein
MIKYKNYELHEETMAIGTWEIRKNYESTSPEGVPKMLNKALAYGVTMERAILTIASDTAQSNSLGKTYSLNAYLTEYKAVVYDLKNALKDILE